MRRALAITAAVAAAVIVTASATATASAARARFDTQVFALIPPPGFPAMAYVAPNHRVYEGTYDNPSGSSLPSRVLEYDGGGALLRSWTIFGETLSGSHGVQVATSDGSGRLVLLDKSPARVLLLDPRTGSQSTYATFPTTVTPNYAAWGPDGSLYVTDYTEPIIWRIPPGGGTPQQWLTDPQLNGGMFGTTAILLRADHHSFMVGQQSEAGASAGNPSTGRILTLPIMPDGSPGPLSQFWESGPADGPDGFAIALSGNVYVPLLVANQLAVIGPDGHELTRFPSQPGAGSNGSSVPFDSPSSIRFLGTDVVVANQSYFTGNAAHQAILDVETGEPGLPEFIPAPPAGAPKPAARPPAHHAKKRKKRKARKRTHHAPRRPATHRVPDRV
jgi:streptogramin lyase